MIKTIKQQVKGANTNNSVFADVNSINGNKINIQSAGESRDVKLIAPQGIIWLPAIGSSVEVLKNWGKDKHSVAIGVVCSNNGIQPGELLLYSAGGAKIHLKNDGSIELNNRVHIAPNGAPVTL